MNWHSLNDFLAMGGYAGYVWSALLAVLLAIVAELLALARRGKTARAEVRRRARAGRP